MGIFSRRFLLLCLVTVVLTPPVTHAQSIDLSYDSHLKIVRSILEQPESQIDLAQVKLSIDKIIDPATDKIVLSKKIDDLAAEIKALFPLGANSLTRFKILRDYL
jgi:hypothetical protein